MLAQPLHEVLRRQAQRPLLGPHPVDEQARAVAQVLHGDLQQRLGRDVRLHQALGQPAPAQAGADELQRRLVAVGAAQLAREDKARVGLLRVAAGDQHLALAQQVVHAQARTGAVQGLLRLPRGEVRGHHGHQHLVAHLLEVLAAVQAAALEHQGQLGPAGVQQLQRIGLRGDQHFQRQGRVALGHRAQRVGPGGGQQLRGNRQRQPLFQPLVQGQGLLVQLLQLLGQQPGLGFQGARGGRGRGLAAPAVEQLQAQFGLQLAHGHADGGGHAPQLARGGRERAGVEHGQEQRHLFGGEGHG